MIIGYVGGMSSGKTLSMTRSLYKDHLKGKKILTNYSVTFPHEKFDTKKILEYAKEGKQLSNCSIGIDELYLCVDSRVSSAKKNRIFSYFALQSSKRDVKIYYTTQHFGQVDKRIRQNTHVIIQCSPALLIKRKLRPMQNQDSRKLPKRYQRYFRIVNMIAKRVQVGFSERMKVKRIVIDPKKFWHLYDTSEIINFD